jgi:hypothetical protein
MTANHDPASKHWEWLHFEERAGVLMRMKLSYSPCQSSQFIGGWIGMERREIETQTHRTLERHLQRARDDIVVVAHVR